MSDSLRPQRCTGSPIPGILQARTLEWVAISFSNAWKWSCSVVSDSSRPHGLQPTRLVCPWDSPGKSTASKQQPKPEAKISLISLFLLLRLIHSKSSRKVTDFTNTLNTMSGTFFLTMSNCPGSVLGWRETGRIVRIKSLSYWFMMCLGYLWCGSMSHTVVETFFSIMEDLP